MSDHWTHVLISMFFVSSACTTLLAHRVYEERLAKTWHHTYPDLVWVSGYFNLVVLNLALGFGIQMGPKSCATWRVFCFISMFPVMLDWVRSCSFRAERKGAQGHFLNSGWWSSLNVTSRNGSSRNAPNPCWRGALRDNGFVDLRKRPDFQCLLRTFTWKHGTARTLT